VRRAISAAFAASASRRARSVSGGVVCRLFTRCELRS
jgi:hypothetical protein